MDSKFMSHLLGVKVKGHYSWNVGSRKCYATHGDRWDVYIYKYRLISEWLTAGYNFLRSFSSKFMRKISKFVKTRSKMLLRNHEAILHNALSFARTNGLDAVFCGHTHRACLESVEGLIYGNSGTWESDLPHFVGVNPEGAYLCRYLRKGSFEVVKTLKFPSQN